MVSDRSAPSFWITVYREGMPSQATRIGVDVDLKITSLSFEDADEKADKLTFTVDNFNLDLLDNPVFAHGNRVDVSYGYPEMMSPPRSALVTKVTGGTLLKVEALGKEFGLHKETRTRIFERMKRSDVARQIAEEYGFGQAAQDIEDTGVTLNQITQSGMTDLAFLWDLARRDGAVCFIDEGGFHFKRRNLAQAPLKTLTYYGGAGTDPGTIISFSIDSDIAGKPASVTLVGQNMLTKQKFSVTADNETTGDRPVLGAVSVIVDPTTAGETLQKDIATAVTRATTATTKEEAQRQANGMFLQSALSGVEITLSCIGDAQIHAKSIIRVAGIGARFSGAYYVKSAKHDVASGYRMTLKCKRDGTNKSLSAGASATNSGNTNTQQPEAPGTTRTVKVNGPDGAERTEYH